MSLSCIWVDGCLSAGSVWTLLLFVIYRYSKPSFPPGKKKVQTEMTWTLQDMEDHWLVCYFYPLSTSIMEERQWWLFCLFFLFLPLSLITRRGRCGGVDWELQSTLFTHSWLFGLAGLRLWDTQSLASTKTHTQSYSDVMCIPSSWPCTYTQLSQSAFCYHHIYVKDMNIYRQCCIPRY